MEWDDDDDAAQAAYDQGYDLAGAFLRDMIKNSGLTEKEETSEFLDGVYEAFVKYFEG